MGCASSNLVQPLSDNQQINSNMKFLGMKPCDSGSDQQQPCGRDGIVAMGRQMFERLFRSSRINGVDLNDPAANAAAATIQAAFRGHRARLREEEENNLRSESGAAKTTTTATMKAQAAEEELDVDLSDPDLAHAATKIQATFRGHMIRKQQIQTNVQEAEDELNQKLREAKELADELADVDLSDPDLHKAATKIQASFRGHKVRKQVKDTDGADD